MFEWIFYPWMISNAYTLLIIFARVDLTPIYIVWLSCLLIVEEVIHQFKLKLESSMRIYFNGIRYEFWSFSVRYLISLAYWKGLIFGVKLSVVVPPAIRIYFCNTWYLPLILFILLFLWRIFQRVHMDFYKQMSILMTSMTFEWDVFRV